MKQILLDTVFGHYALALRAKLKLLYTLWFDPEIIGMLTNDRVGTVLLSRLCPPGKRFIDIGAHIGSIISEVRYYDSTVKIIAIEAIPEKADRLKNKFRSVEVHQCALGAKSGQASFYIDTRASGCSSLLPPRNDEGNTIEIVVPMKTLDELVTAADIEVIKIDVEGAELQVLKGAAETIRLNRPTIYFESATSGADSDLAAIWIELTKMGYQVLVPNRLAHDDETGLSEQGFVESHRYPRRCSNYFAVAKEKRIALRDRARLILGIRAG